MPVALATVQSRAVAYALDAGITSVPLAVVVTLSALDPLAVILLTQTVYFLYFVILWSPVGGGRTVGMRALGIRVVSVDGGVISLLRAVVRYVVQILGMALLFVGVIWILADERRQGWHDKVARTLVVRM